MINDIEIITIPLEEYKELLTIKGRYEELKSMYYGPYSNTKITYRGGEEGVACVNGSVTFNNDTPFTYTGTKDLGV